MSTVPIAGTSINTYLPMLMLIVFFLALFRQFERFLSLIPGFEAEGIHATNSKSCCYCIDDSRQEEEESTSSSGILTSEQMETIQAGKRLVEVGRNQLARLCKESCGKPGLGLGVRAGVGTAERSIREQVAASLGVVESPIMKIGALPAELLSNLQAQMKAESHRSHRYGHLDIDTPEGCFDDEEAAEEAREEFNIDIAHGNRSQPSIFERRADTKDVELPPSARGRFNIDMEEEQGDQQSIFSRGRYADSF